MSSRKEFYSENRLDVEEQQHVVDQNREWIQRMHAAPLEEPEVFSEQFDLGMAVVELGGIQSSYDLVNRIFDKHRTRSPWLASVLNERSFLDFIDRSYDSETGRLSRNPLFLTVMCYVYIKSMRQCTFPDQTSSVVHSTIQDLVSQCTNLLLVDLDEQKTRNIDKATMRALKSRSANPNEKNLFLRYFAASLYLDHELTRRNVFSRDDLHRIARQYFSSSRCSSDLLNGLRRSGDRNIVDQLILQGVFVIVDYSLLGAVFDFPHRRFREVLACQYFDDAGRVGEILQRLGEVQYRELILVFFSSSRSYQETILCLLLEEIDKSDRWRYFTDLTAACLRVKPATFAASPLIEAWIHRTEEKRVEREFPGEILRHLISNSVLAEWVALRLGLHVRSVNLKAVGFFLRLTFIVDVNMFRRLVREVESDQSISNDARRLVAQIRRSLEP